MSILSSKPLSTPKRNGTMAALKRSVTESLVTLIRGLLTDLACREGKENHQNPNPPPPIKP
jgi:hypothetical protein